ncbi:hypothetical protein [Peribacillus loiseleuriae]|uniref:Uncharacterized protein n=1 Tax=Peribacillus loiseleuriae TaxID=1679170 RepID=A0A0K9GSG8_9BACI|nr:hypothetical protein [Peribacillus loiseleuriae]KMY49575.1 hypothetical protein AC625_08480 [Peribacillus loiseleuriae]
MKYYLQVQPDGRITDAITYPFGNYIEYEAESLPMEVIGGWFKLENDVIVEYPELKPVTKDEEIEQLQQDLGMILLESANDKARIVELEINQGEMLMEIATLKMGGNL